MMKKLLLLMSLFPCLIYSQTKVGGQVMDEGGSPVAFANVYLADIFDGTSTDESGNFEFSTDVTGEVVLVVSALAYETKHFELTLVEGSNRAMPVLAKAVAELEEVVISAGAFEASNEKKGTLLKPLDIVQNPVASGDLYGALQTLPGVSVVGEETGIFVRGGEAYETKTIIDGMIVQKPFFSEVPDLPSRGRFDPFMFKGTLFSTGGYSAEYGQALSSVLLLNTQDIPDESFTGVGVNMAGLDITTARVSNEKSVLLGSIGYTNLAPYFNLLNPTREWKEAPIGFGGGVAFKKKTPSGLFKTMAQLQGGSRGLNFPSLNNPGLSDNFSSHNLNGYWNTSYKGIFKEKWSVFGGLALGYDNDEGRFNEHRFGEKSTSLQSRITLGRDLSESIYLRFGAESQFALANHYADEWEGELRGDFAATYLEADTRLSRKIALRTGIRLEYDGLIEEVNLGPRLSLAYKTGAKSQVSLAYGQFYQTPEYDFLFFDRQLDFEQATHYILNYQWLSEDYTFRIEAYRKNYQSLVKKSGSGQYDNSGDGLAQGLEVFWRDKKTIPNLDYWITYSYVDAERNYRDFPERATPSFITEHTFNLVSRYEVVPLRTRIGLGYTFASGRPYDNPNEGGYLESRTRAYHNLSVNMSYITTMFRNFTVIYLSFRNPLGFDQVFGYRYSTDGSVRAPVVPNIPRSVFAGLYISFQ